MTAGLSSSVGRGALANLAFGVSLQALVALQAVLVPRLLGPGAIGVFALATAGVALGTTVKSIDLPSKVVQEREVDLHTSYQVAFTLEVVMASVAMVGVLAAAPLLAHLYHRPSLWPLMAILSLGLFQTALLDLPASLPYREMRFVRRNLLTSVGPLVSVMVTLGLAYAGFGVWSLAAGTLSGLAVSILIVAFASPIPPRLVWNRAVARRFLSFGVPIWTQSMLVFLAGWGAVITISATVGVSGLGYFETSQSWSSRALQVDGFLSDAIFPALCSMQAATARLRRAFIVTNRLSMIWAAPVGMGMVALAHPSVMLLLGHRWGPAVLLVQAEGISIVLNAVGLNWRLFYVARGQTRPLMVMGIVTAMWLVGCVIPLLIIWKLKGAALSIILLGVFGLAFRQFYVNRMFGRTPLLRMTWREMAAGGLGAGAVEGLRVLGWRATSVITLGVQALVVLGVTAAIAWLVDRELISSSLRAVLHSRGSDDPPAESERGSVVHRQTTRLPGSFPMLVEADNDGRHLWVATRDRPALGRYDLASDQWQWVTTGPFPHRPTPDGEGGCWSALTRARQVVRVGPASEGGLGQTTSIHLPSSDELLVTAYDDGHTLWAVDSRKSLVWRIQTDQHPPTVGEISLPAEMRRPDFISNMPWGQIWVADTAVAVLAVIDPLSGAVSARAAPHPTRCILADPGRGGCWLGASDRGLITLVSPNGDVRDAIALPGVPFGMTLAADGRLVAALKDLGAIAAVDTDARTVQWLDVGVDQMPFDVAAVGLRCFVTLAGSSVLAEVLLPAGTGPDMGWQPFPPQSGSVQSHVQ